MNRKRDVSIILVSIFLLATLIGFIPTTNATNQMACNTQEQAYETVDFQFSFDPSEISLFVIDGLTAFEMDNMDTTIIPGEPLVPVEKYSFVIDPYAYDVEIEITYSHYSNIPAVGPFLGVPEQIPISQPKDMAVQASSKLLKGPVRMIEAGYIRGYHIQDVIFQPIVPRDDDSIDIYSYVEGKIQFKLPDDELVKVDSAKRLTSSFRSYLMKNVGNSEDLGNYMAKPLSAPVSQILQSKDVQYVIITNTSKVGDHLDKIKDWKVRKGVPTEIVEMSFITSNYNGTDNQDKIRNFIKDAVTTWDTEYVLLGGDVSVVPYRSTYVKVGTRYETDCAADLYYSDLDGNFDGDNDLVYGELTDNLDLKPDVIVGRAPAQNSPEMSTFVTKTLKYETDPILGYLDNVTLAGEYLNESTNSSLGMDMIKNNILPLNINATSLYDSEMGTFGNLNKYTFQAQVNKGLSYAFHSGHSNYNVMSVGTAANGYLSRSDVTSYNGGYKLGVMNSLGCIANRFSVNDCIGELHVMESDGGSVVYIGNSRFGWYSPMNPGGGTSEVYQRRMATELFTNGNTHMGEHFAYAKEAYTGWAVSYNQPYLWLQMALNMMGEPEMHARTAEPSVFNITLPLNLGKSYPDFYVTVLDGTGSPVKDALVCLQQSDFYGYNMTGSNGRAYFNFSTQNYDLVNVTVTGYNYLPFSGNISIDMTPPSVVVNHKGNATTGDEYTFNCTVTDEAGVQRVFLDMYPDGGDVNDTITYYMVRNDTNWITPLTIPFNSNDDLYFRMRAMDNPGNWNETGWNKLVVNDNDEPWFTSDITEKDSTTGENITFVIGIDDNIDVTSALISIWWNGSIENQNHDMINSDGSWNYTFDLPLDRIGDLRYRIIASDFSGNLNGSYEGSVEILDNDVPEFKADLTINNASTSGICHFKVDVEDNIGVEAVFVEYWRNGYMEHETSPMVLSDDIWTYPLELPDDDLDYVHHIFHAVDSSENWNQTLEGTIRVFDDDEPQFLTDWTSDSITTGEEFEIRIEVVDNIMVTGVTLTCSQLEEPVNMTQNDDGINWTYSIKAPEGSTGSLTYQFRATDPYDNINISLEGDIDVIDNDGPTFGEPHIPETIDAGDNITIMIDIFDNIGMGDAELTWWLGGMEDKTSYPMVLENNWTIFFNIPRDAYGTIYFTIEANDLSGNAATSERFGVGIIEYIPPEDPEPGDDDDDDDEPVEPGDDDDDDDQVGVPTAGEDLDHDGMEDLWEYLNGLDITIDDGSIDPDNDSYTNLEEFEKGTDPQDDASSPLPRVRDTLPDEDGDSLILLILAGAGVLVLIMIIGVAAVVVRRRSHYSNEEMVVEEDDDDEVLSWD